MKLSARKRISCSSFSMSVPSDAVAAAAEVRLRTVWDDDDALWSTSNGKLCFDVICCSVLYFSVTIFTLHVFLFVMFSVIKLRKSSN